LAGAVITETIFGWPGVGFYVTRAIRSLDYQPTISFTVVAGLSYVLINLVVDLMYVAIDPRIKLASSSNK
jgi:peptide/nickel transport system permease protein